MSDKLFFEGLLVGVTISFLFCATSDYIEKNNRQRGEIKKLISRLEECEKNHESSHELKK